MGKNSMKPLEKIMNVADIMPVPDTLDFFTKLTEAYRENKITEREVFKVDSQQKVLICEITKKYDLYHKVFDHIFDERKQGIGKSFEIIDRGIRENDNEKISLGLGALSKIVSSSPFANIQELSKLLESGQKIEI